jgi:O-antigen/teichoic acid export membrane protein
LKNKILSLGLYLNKYFTFDKDIANKQLFSLMASIVNVVYGFIILLISTRYLPVEEYGKYFYIISIMAVARVTIFPGFEKTIPGYIVKGDLMTVHSVNLKSAKFGIFGLVGLVSYGLLIKDTDLKLMLFAASFLYIPFYLSQRIFQILAGLEKFYDIFLIRLIASIILLIINFLVLVILNANAKLYFIANLSTSVLIFSSVYFYYIKKEISVLHQSKIHNEKIHSALTKGKQMTYAGLPTMLLDPLITIYIGNLISMSDVSIYNIAKNIFSMTGNLIKSALRPISVQYCKKNTNILNKKTLSIYFILGVCLYLLFLVVVDLIFPFILVGDYTQSIELIRILCISLVIEPLAIILLQHITFNSLVKEYTLSINIVLIIQVFLYFTLVPQYGIKGLIFVNLVIVFIRALMNTFLIRNSYLNKFKIG